MTLQEIIQRLYDALNDAAEQETDTSAYYTLVNYIHSLIHELQGENAE